MDELGDLKIKALAEDPAGKACRTLVLAAMRVAEEVTKITLTRSIPSQDLSCAQAYSRSIVWWTDRWVVGEITPEELRKRTEPHATDLQRVCTFLNSRQTYAYNLVREVRDCALAIGDSTQTETSISSLCAIIDNRAAKLLEDLQLQSADTIQSQMETIARNAIFSMSQQA